MKFTRFRLFVVLSVTAGTFLSGSQLLPAFSTLQPSLNKQNSACREEVNVPFEPLTIFADEHRGGDDDIYGRGDFTLTAATEVGTQGNLHVRLSFENKERSDDWTFLRGERLYTQFVPQLANSQCELISVTPNWGIVQGSGRWKDHSFRTYYGDGLITTASIRTDTVDGDVGETGGTVNLAPIKLRFSTR